MAGYQFKRATNVTAGFVVLFLVGMVLNALYPAHVALVLLSIVATVAGFALFESDLLRFISSSAVYAYLAAPFLLVYGRYGPLEGIRYFAVVSGIAVICGALLLDDLFLESLFFRIFQQAKRSLKARKVRYALTLFSVSTYVAGITALSSTLLREPYTLFFLSGIVVCTIAVTILGNIYGRTREIFTLATVGLNPDHFVGLCLAEAFTMSFLGGGIGYGAGLYAAILGALPVSKFQLTTELIVGVILISTGVAFAASILLALKASMMATPSLLKRWWREAPPIVGWPPKWTFTLPVKVARDTVEDFIYDYMERLPKSDKLYSRVESVYDFDLRFPELEPNKKPTWTLSFKYYLNDGTVALETKNELRVFTAADSEELRVDFTISVDSYQNVQDSQTMRRYLEMIGSVFRTVAFEWTRGA